VVRRRRREGGVGRGTGWQIATLAEALSSRDERVRVVAAQALLDRAWGKPKEAKDDDQQQVSVDLSRATAAELQVLLALVQRGALRPASSGSGSGTNRDQRFALWVSLWVAISCANMI
jgi:hypothetical protein